MRGIGALVCGCVVSAATVSASGAEHAWVPVEASGGYTIIDNEIILDDGGQTVTLELRMSGWDPDLDGSPRLGVFQATVDPSGFLGDNAVPPHSEVDLTPLGWPDDPGQGGFQILKRCTIGGTPDINGMPCSMTPECPSGESCVDNPDWVFAGLDYIAAVSTADLDYYAWGSTVMGGSAADDGESRYGGTLILEVPADTVGTYTIGFNPVLNYTFMSDEFGEEIPVLALVPARITIQCETDEECDDGASCSTHLCDPTSHLCEYVVDPGYCVVGSACVPDGTLNPDNECESCDPAINPLGWSLVADGTPCTDDELFCTGQETCVRGSCDSSGNPCTPSGTWCIEDLDECVECKTNYHCRDELFCNGEETCVDYACQPGTPPCDAPGWGCDEGSDECVCETDEACDDGLFCTGTESCVDGACAASGDPCSGLGLLCDDDLDECVDCLSNGDCGDGDDCTDDVCDAGSCTYPFAEAGTKCGNLADDACTDPDTCDGVGNCLDNHAPNGTPCPNLLFCDGEESCVDGTCAAGDPECDRFDLECNEALDECVCALGFDCDILRVDIDATGRTFDGLTWCTAFTNPQDALEALETSPVTVTEIRVAAGVYYPDQGASQTPGDRGATFELVTGVEIMGGYAGCGTADPDRRHIVAYQTVLSGDLVDDDSPSTCCQIHDGVGCDESACETLVCTERPSCCTNAWTGLCASRAMFLCTGLCDSNNENSYHVVSSPGVGTTAVLDGFTITAGKADGSPQFGGGLYNNNGSPTLVSCTFTDNVSFSGGGGAFNNDGAAAFTGCTFEKNISLGGGGGMGNDSATAPVLDDCDFTDNWAGGDGGGMRSMNGSTPTLTGCTFTANRSALDGGGVYSDNSEPSLTDCTFTANVAGAGGGMLLGSGGGSLDNCTFIGNTGLEGGGMLIGNSDPTLTDCTFTENAAEHGGGLANERSSPTLIDCSFVENHATEFHGGGIYNSDDSDPTLTRARFIGNTALQRGGAIYVDENCDATLADSLLNGNGANYGGGIYVRSGGSALVENCTIAGNDGTTAGGGVFTRDMPFSLGNCVLWGNTSAFSPDDEAAQITAAPGVTPTVDYTCIQGWTGLLGGVGNHGDDPLFVDADGPDNIPGNEDDDLRLIAGSPGINSGNPSYPADPGDTDLSGNPRLQGCRVDRGAYESSEGQLQGDFDGDDDFDLADFAGFQSCLSAVAANPEWSEACLCVFDFDESGDVDLVDYADFAPSMMRP